MSLTAGLLKAAPTILSIGSNLFQKKGPTMAQRQSLLQPWKQGMDDMEERAEMYRDPESEFWRRQEGYLTNQVLQNQDWSNMFIGRQFGNMGMASPMMAQKQLNQNLSSMNTIPGILNKAWMNQQGTSDDMMKDVVAGRKAYGEQMQGFLTEDQANRGSRLTDMTKLLGGLQKSDVWSNLFNKAGACDVADKSASDERLKENIHHIGEDKGLNIYEFNYKDTAKHGEGRFAGVMAQELLETNYKDAIHFNDEGYMMVDYAKLPVKMTKVG